MFEMMVSLLDLLWMAGAENFRMAHGSLHRFDLEISFHGCYTVRRSDIPSFAQLITC